MFLFMLKNDVNKGYRALSRINTELSFMTEANFTSPKIVLAIKPEKRKSRADRAIPNKATMAQAEKKSSRILLLSSSTAKKRIIDALKASIAKGVSKEIVTLISDQLPYAAWPSPLVKMGI